MVQDLYFNVRDLTARVQSLERRLGRVTVGTNIRASAITGIIPSSSGGSNVIGNVLGAVSVWQNDSGGQLSQGAVVALKGDRTFDTTTTEGDLTLLGVLDGSATSTSTDVADQANGRIRHVGYQTLVNVEGAVVVGDYLQASTTAGSAASAGTEPVAGAFAIALTANASGSGQVAAWVFPIIAGAGGGGGGGPQYIPFGSEASDGEVFSP